MPTQISAGDRTIGDGHPAFIIAEAGINHNGDFDKARQLVDLAREANADAVKFQTHFPAVQMLREGPSASHVGGSLYDILEQTKLTEEEHWKLQEHAHSAGIRFLSTPFSREAADFLAGMGVDVFKIGSGEMTNLPLLEHVAGLNKPMLVSTGMSAWEELERSCGLLKELGASFALFHCVSSYPTQYRDLNLRVIPKMKAAFNVPVGLSDHSLGIYAALAAIPLGANLIEKHFTVDKDWPGPDQKSSLDPRELRELVIGVRVIEQALGDQKCIAEDEQPVKKMAASSIVSITDIREGETFTTANTWVKRPGSGLPAHLYQRILGRQATRDIPADSLLTWDAISES